MSDSRWFRNDVDWWEQEWCLPLSSEAKHCYNLMLCRIGAVGQHGRAKKTPLTALARQWFVGEESIRQMLIAAVGAGLIVDDGQYWEVKDPTIYAKDATATERKRAQRERERESRMSRDVTDVTDVTVQDKTRQDIQDNTPPTPSRGKREVFVKPSVEECVAYSKTLRLPASEAKLFHDHFSSNGWKVGGKAPMRDWRASMRTWTARWGKSSGGARAGQADWLEDMPA